MQTSKAQIESWHAEGLELASAYSRAEARMVELLSWMAEVDGYLHFHCESLRAYALSIWKLPEYSAYDMVTVARKAVQIPELLAALKRGKTSVSKLRRICAVITAENRDQWIDIAERCSSREIEKLIAAARPEKIIKEGFIYRAENLLEMRAAVTEDVSEAFLRVQDIQSQRLARAATFGEVLDEITRLALEKLDPVKKAERAVTKDAAQEKGGTCHVASAQRREKKRPAGLTHQINLRDQAQCTHVDPDGQRCKNRRWLEVHHLLPRSEGGTDTLENLVTLCSRHHRLVHFERGPPDQH